MSDIDSINSSRFFNFEPDFNLPVLRLPQQVKNNIAEKLIFLYGDRKAKKCLREIERVIAVHHAHKTPEMLEFEKTRRDTERFSETDVVLITYGDLITDKDQKPLQTLIEISSDYFFSVFFNTIHILPFFPSSSDRGFSIRDFREVDPNLGTWDDITDIKQNFKLMFDGVFNHVSSKSLWFQEFLNGNPDYQDFFHSFSDRRKIPREQISMLMRPRTTDVFTKFATYNGNRLVWTTFSSDQIDLNFKNPKVLVNIIDVLLFYIRKGADIIRLDAVTYLWHQLGTTGAHLMQTHTIIKLFRTILDAVAPHVSLITETNVPHKDNMTYFGNGNDEAHMIYNFALPPLIIHTFLTGNSKKITGWAKTLRNPSVSATFFNFLDSHDGIGVMGASGILNDGEIEFMAQKTREHGGFVSFKKDTDGTEKIYELNISSYDALNRNDSNESIDFQVKRYIAARSIILVLAGVPGVYIHGFLGTRNYIDGVTRDHDNRSINRYILSKDELVKALLDRKAPTHKVINTFGRIIHKRTREKSFHPHAGQEVLDFGEYFFCVARHSLDGSERIISIANVTDVRRKLDIDLEKINLNFRTWRDVLSGKNFRSRKNRLSLTMKPYDVLWLKAEGTPPVDGRLL